MLNDSTKKQLDDIIEAIDTKIDSRLDAMEIQQQKSQFARHTPSNLQGTIQKGLVANKGNREFEIKAGELFISEISSGTMVPEMYESTIKNLPFQSDLRSIFPAGTTESDTVTINRGVYATNSAAITTEATQYPESTNTMSAVSFSIDKLAHRFDLSLEFLEDVPSATQFIVSQITGGLIEKINGNIITDVKANDVAFDTTASGSLYQSIDSAQEYDVLVAGLNQMRKGNYNPDFILLNPTDYAKLAILKDSNGAYLKGGLFQSNRPSIDGVTIQQSSAVTSGEFHIMDSNRYGRYFNRESLTVLIGLDGNDFSSGTRTAIAVHRGKLGVFDTSACVSGTFSTAITSLETP